MYTIFAVAIVIVVAVLLLSLIITSKAYRYKHTVDPLENNPYLNQQNKDEKQDEKKPHSHE